MPFSKLSDAELIEELMQLHSKAAATASSFEPLPRAKRRARNLMISAATAISGAAISGISDLIALSITLPSLYVLFDNIVEDAEIHADELNASAQIEELKLLRQEAELELVKRGLLP